MRGIGVLEDRFVFTEAELERGAPRFWWGPRRRAAYDRVLARRGMSRREGRGDDNAASSTPDNDERDHGTWFAATASCRCYGGCPSGAELVGCGCKANTQQLGAPDGQP